METLSGQTNHNDNEQREPSLESLSMPDLRKQASAMNVPFTRDTTKQELLQLVKAVKDRKNYAVTALGERPPPGYARIELMKNPDPSASNIPVTFSVNTYQVFIPRGVQVDVPIKILRGAIMNSKQRIMRENRNVEPTSPNRYEFIEVYSYPFTVYDIHEGPDVKNTYELLYNSRYGARKKFREIYGYWPNSQEERAFKANKCEGLPNNYYEQPA